MINTHYVYKEYIEAFPVNFLYEAFEEAASEENVKGFVFEEEVPNWVYEVIQNQIVIKADGLYLQYRDKKELLPLPRTTVLILEEESKHEKHVWAHAISESVFDNIYEAV